MQVGLRWVLVIVLAMLPWTASAEMVLNKVVVQFTPDGQRRDDIEVVNLDPDLLYLAVEPREVIDPGTEDEQRIERSDPEQMGLLVSPERAVVEAGARRIVRLSLLQAPEAQDRVWRVTFRPVPAGTDGAAGTGSQLRILAAYNVLVIAYSPVPRADLAAQRQGRRLRLQNLGNSNALLFDGEQCDQAGEQCRDLPTRRLYAGNVWELTLPYDTPAYWRQLTIDKIDDVQF